MDRYVALLRGINVGRKNKLSMSELKEELKKDEFTDVVTYLNSGNVIFSSNREDPQILANKMRTRIKLGFELDIPIHVILQAELKELLANAPEWWGDENKEIYDNVIFMMKPLSFEVLLTEIGEPKADFERVYPYKDIVFWSFIRKEHQKTNWWAKTAKPKVKDQLTIRTANTVRKIVDM